MITMSHELDELIQETAAEIGDKTGNDGEIEFLNKVVSVLTAEIPRERFDEIEKAILRL